MSPTLIIMAILGKKYIPYRFHKKKSDRSSPFLIHPRKPNDWNLKSHPFGTEIHIFKPSFLGSKC